MTRLKHFWNWLLGSWEDLLKNSIPILTVIFAFVSLNVELLNATHTIVLILLFLAINALVERFLSLKRIESSILSIEDAELTHIAPQLGISGITSSWTTRFPAAAVKKSVTCHNIRTVMRLHHSNIFKM